MRSIYEKCVGLLDGWGRGHLISKARPMVFVVGVVLVGALPGGLVFAQSGPTLDPTGTILTNPTKRPLLFLLHTPSTASVAKTQTVLVGAGSTAAVSMPAGSLIAQEMALNPMAGFGKIPRGCKAGGQGISLTPAVVSEELQMQEHALDEKRAASEAYAGQVGAVELADYFDEAEVRRNDPVQAELRSEAIRDAGGYSPAQAQQDNQQTVMELTGAVVAMGLANGESISAHSAAAGDEESMIEGMISKKKEFLIHMQAAYASESVLNKGDREYNAFAATELSKVMGASPSVSVPPHVEFGRVCGGPAPDIDDLAIKMPGPTGTNVMLGRAHFDKGGEEDLVFRRVIGTPQWLASIYWPVESSRATVSLRNGKGWAKVGDVKTDRESLEVELEQAHKSIGSLARKRRAAAYAADGGDENRTVVMP